MSPLSLRRYRAERLLRRDFDGLRSTVLHSVARRLSARGVEAAVIDLDACYAQAWQGLYANVLEGDTVENPTGWLVVVTFRRAIEDARTLRARGSRPLEDANARAVEADAAARVDDADRLREVFEALRARMDGRECDAATLCYVHGLSRAEAAQRMGISERRMRKLMDGAAGRPGVAAKMNDLLAIVGGGRWCEQQASLMRGLAFGLLDPGGERHRLAVAHQRACPACRAYVVSLRGLAAALPPVGIPLGLGAVGAAGAGAGSAAGGGWLLAGGSLSAKLAAGCLVALGIGAGCVALTAPRGSAPSPARVAAHRGAGHPSRAVAALAEPAARGASGGIVGTVSTVAARVPPRSGGAARREFGPEARHGAIAAAPAVARPAAYRPQRAAAAPPAPAATAASPGRPEPRARREFGAG